MERHERGGTARRGQTGLRGQGAIVEILRRSGKDQRSIKWLTWAILALTVFIAVLTVILVMRG